MKDNRTTELLANPKPTDVVDSEHSQQPSNPSNSSSADRRKFLGQVGIVTASTIVAGTAGAVSGGSLAKGLPVKTPNSAPMNDYDCADALFLREVLRAFQNMVLKYYHTPGSGPERAERLALVTDILRSIKLPIGEEVFTRSSTWCH